MRTKWVVVAACLMGAVLIGSGCTPPPAAPAGVPGPTTTTVVDSPATGPSQVAPTKPTQAQIDAFLRALVPPNTGSGRRIIYSNTWQRVWLVDDANRLVRSYLVSGRRNTPHAGVYRVYSKSRFASSGSAHMEFMVRFAHGRSMAIGFHSIPYVGSRPLSTIQQLGTYRSHGCVRQWILDAAYLYMWAPIGTVVVVTP
jgi:lipoprotein-anchoring transpeptidase ErfK/SrfK